MSEPRSENVQIPRAALLALVLGLVLCLMLVAFLLGRQSAPPPPAPPPPASSPRAESSVPVESSNQLQVADVPTPAPEAPPVAPPPPPVAAPPPPPVAAPAPAPEAAPAPPAVAAPHPRPKPRVSAVQQYLSRIDAVMASTGDLGDPTQFATGVLGKGASGDATGFDSLLAKTRKAQADLAKIHPPAGCKEHYALTQAQLAGSITLLEGVKRATMSMDTAGLPALAAQGQAMQAKAERLQVLTDRLRQSGT